MLNYLLPLDQIEKIINELKQLNININKNNSVTATSGKNKFKFDIKEQGFA